MVLKRAIETEIAADALRLNRRLARLQQVGGRAIGLRPLLPPVRLQQVIITRLLKARRPLQIRPQTPRQE